MPKSKADLLNPLEEPRRVDLPPDLPPLPVEEGPDREQKNLHPNRRAREGVLGALYSYGRQESVDRRIWAEMELEGIKPETRVMYSEVSGIIWVMTLEDGASPIVVPSMNTLDEVLLKEREYVAASAVRRFKLRKGQVDFFYSLFRNVLDHQTYLDHEVGAVLENWTVPRLAEVERLLLRMGSAELLLLRNLDVAIPINETVELAKTFGDADSGRFINGVLDALAKKRRGTEG